MVKKAWYDLTATRCCGSTASKVGSSLPLSSNIQGISLFSDYGSNRTRRGIEVAEKHGQAFSGWVRDARESNDVFAGSSGTWGNSSTIRRG